MKCFVMIMLAAFMAASSITKAGDTLRIESVRTVNLCSNDKTFLLTASIGEVFFSDSLMYFDITLRYDTSVIRPTQGFPQGTLAGQLEFGEYNPAYNFRTPGEIKVSAFSISTHAKGNIPLIAIGGNFVGDCHDSDSITVPTIGMFYALDFNKEFKRKVTVDVSEIFAAVAIPVIKPSIGATIDTEAVHIESPDSTASFTIDLTTPELKNTRAALTVTKVPTNGISIDTVILVGATADSMKRIGIDTVKVYYVAPSGPLQAQVVLSASHERNNDSTTFTASVQSLEDCGCITPAKTDSVRVVTHKKTVSALSDVDEDSVTIRMMEDAIVVQGVHGQPGFLTVYALDGAIVYRVAFNEGTNRIQVPIHDLPHGVYFVKTTSGGLTLTKKLLK